MKTAIIRTTEDVDSTTTLTIGDRVLNRTFENA
ncbi:hypothetical protein RB43ORF135c [Escherichia phage RB43]|uniref:Uncharacterized protein n=1 Tax=Escherichia phage RB43 TaxID=2887182 RepID=Q56BR3_9CAUD|nr:hypothetical protein RB43ORF135c [Escherichia phage RB43]AAX78657.1 hypothetical protein RB43ORF135c [Escherichia phage RB43]